MAGKSSTREQRVETDGTGALLNMVAREIISLELKTSNKFWFCKMKMKVNIMFMKQT